MTNGIGKEIVMDVEAVDELDLATQLDAQAAVSAARWYSQAARELQEADGWHDTAQRIVELAGEDRGRRSGRVDRPSAR